MSSNPFNASYKGYLQKQGHLIKNWRTRYFVVKKCITLYYNTEELSLNGERPKGSQIVTSVRSWPDEPLGFIFETFYKKTFNVKCSSRYFKNF